MAATSKRVLWKGAISFGLVHIPIALHSATQEQGLDFDWLDKRTMDPVGYKRINKKTGKDISQENIVKGIEYEDGHYVVLTPEEIQAAYPKTTQTIEIESLVPADSLPFTYLERPYYISPINKGEKVYALLREVLIKTGKIGLPKVIIQTKQHLAVLIPSEPALVLNLLCWGDEIRTWEELNLPKEGIKANGLTDKELKMGEQLVEDMSGEWNPEQFTDSFKEQILHLVDEKVKAGETASVTPIEKNARGDSATIYDLTEMLQRSLKGKTTAVVTEKNSSPKKPGTKTASKSTASTKTPKKEVGAAKPLKTATNPTSKVTTKEITKATTEAVPKKRSA